MNIKILAAETIRGISSLVICFMSIIILSSGCKNDGPTSPGNGALSLSFQSNKGNFSASGKYDTTATSGSGVGAFRSTDSKRISVFAYRFNSSADVDVIIMLISDTVAIHTTTYHYGPSDDILAFYFYPHVNPAGSSGLGYPYRLSSGDLAITGIASEGIQGTFAGKGVHAVNPSDSIIVSNGTFNSVMEVISSTEPMQINKRFDFRFPMEKK